MKRYLISTVLTAFFLSLGFTSAMGAEKAEGEMGQAGKQQELPFDMATSYTASDVMDKQVKNEEDKDLGKINELVINDEGQITHAILAKGGVLGVGAKLYAIPWDRIDLSKEREHVVLNVSEDQLSTEFSAFEEMPEQEPQQQEQQEQPGMEEQGAPDPSAPE